jgi:RND family efflux transporter MFP subunit
MKNILYLLVAVVAFSCASPKAKEPDATEKHQYVKEQNPVKISVLAESTFNKELVMNGKLCALKKSVLRFRTNEELAVLNVRNGQSIKKGKVIAVLHDKNLKQELAQSETRLKKAFLDLQDVLIGQGYELKDSLSVPVDIMEIAKIRSGYTEALNSVAKARGNYRSTKLLAPFSGKIANLKCKLFEKVSAGDDFCLLIDDSAFEVEFSVLETELSDINIGQKVKIIPFSSDNPYRGKVSEINPTVEENGLIKIKALVKNRGKLIEGMNVKVLLRKEVPNKLVVPKSAVVLRDNQEVLFKYTNGIAFWTYVRTGFENTDSYTVIAHPDKSGSLAPGDTVIISGNLNLAHESDVVIK